MVFQRDLTKIRSKGNGTRKWEATVPLLSVPHSTARRFASALAKIANGNMRRYKFGVAMEGSGVMQGEIEITDDLREMAVRWLGAFPKPSKPILIEIAAALKQIEWTEGERVAEPSAGKVIFGINVLLEATTPQSVLAFMVASVLHSGYGENVRQCPKETARTKCGLWFVDFPVGRTVKKYCSPAHQNAHAKYLSVSKKGKAK